MVRCYRALDSDPLVARCHPTTAAQLGAVHVLCHVTLSAAPSGQVAVDIAATEITPHVHSPALVLVCDDSIDVGDLLVPDWAFTHLGLVHGGPAQITLLPADAPVLASLTAICDGDVSVADAAMQLHGLCVGPHTAAHVVGSNGRATLLKLHPSTPGVCHMHQTRLVIEKTTGDGRPAAVPALLADDVATLNMLFLPLLSLDGADMQLTDRGVVVTAPAGYGKVHLMHGSACTHLCADHAAGCVCVAVCSASGVGAGGRRVSRTHITRRRAAIIAPLRSTAVVCRSGNVIAAKPAAGR